MRRGLIAMLVAALMVAASPMRAQQSFAGFDANLYPGDAALPVLHKKFAYTGFWLNTPPGESSNPWHGKRGVVRDAGFGFLLLYNGLLDDQLLAAAKKSKANPEVMGKSLGERDAKLAIAAARAEGFPEGAVIFLDIEEGGRMLPEQAAYILAWTEAVGRSAYKPGAYCSGQPVNEGHGVHITTAEDIRTQVAAKHLHPVVLWIAQDACPPAPGCVTAAPALSRAGIEGIEVWQYAQSPRRRGITLGCAKTYTKGACVVPELPAVEMDMNAASSADPSKGR